MDSYTSISYQLSRSLTKRYSTSFSLSTRLFASSIRPAIYAVYGMVRLADEIVDTHRGPEAERLLDEFENDVYQAIELTYSANPLLHSFSDAARTYGIDRELIEPFFHSMRLDLNEQQYDRELYERYIYGSAEVVGLMCLRVFVRGDEERYQSLVSPARALGAAYQKVNFLRDIKADAKELGRWYFPNASYESFDEADKAAICADIDADFAEARRGIGQLPNDVRRAVNMSYVYYSELHEKLRSSSAEAIKQQRIRVSTPRKLWLFCRGAFS